jgi:hypothetical protein
MTCRQASWRGLGNAGLGWALAMLGLGGSCNFDSAFQRYCENNPRCLADAASGPAAGPEVGPEAKPDAEPELGPQVEPDAEAEPGPEAEPDAGPGPGLDVGPSRNPGRDGGPDGLMAIRPPRSCSSPTDCNGLNEICHPFGQVCMTTCRTSTDCPPWLDACAEISDPSGARRSPKVCGCTPWSSCDSYVPGFRCNPADNLCEPPCHTTFDCSVFQQPRVCNPDTNFCSPTQSCLSDADCYSAAQPHCDLTLSSCVGCVSAADCSGRVDGLSECSPNGSCVRPSA